MSNNNDNDNDDVEGDLNNEVFMELIANQKKVRHNKKQNKIKIQPIGPEFSRIVNIEQVPGKTLNYLFYTCCYTYLFIHTRETPSTV
jgi:hypothetical protein